jgi:hypothetical protein
MFIEFLFDWLSHAPDLVSWAMNLNLAAAPAWRETGRQIASLVGILLLPGLWLHLAMHWDRRMANLSVLALMGLASGAGYALGKEARLELLRAGVSQLVLFLEVFIALSGGWREALRVFVIVLMTGAAATSVGAVLAASFSGAGPAGELIVEFLVALFY